MQSEIILEQVNLMYFRKIWFRPNRWLVRNGIYAIIIVLGLFVPYILWSKAAAEPAKIQKKVPKKIPEKMVVIEAKKENPIRLITLCNDRTRDTHIDIKGDYLVYYNIAKARGDYQCHQSITLTTNGDYTVLNNLEELVERWKGPISVAVYAPGHDFQPTLDAIAYLRNCVRGSIRQFVTFHIFYELKHFPKGLKFGARKKALALQNVKYDCTPWKKKKNSKKKTPFTNIKRSKLYTTKNSLKYPINVARNIAIEAAQTHFVFDSDIEMLPSVGIIKKFLHMIEKHPQMEYPVAASTRHVYAVPVFEIEQKSKVPKNKAELQKMIKTKKASVFKSPSCKLCHEIPDKQKWVQQKDDNQLNIFKNVKRIGKYKQLEPYYIGTHREPPFDERITLESSSDKMIQAFTLCTLGYNIRILDDVFLTHKSRKVKRDQKKEARDRMEASHFILEDIVPELLNLYGSKEGCMVGGEFAKKQT